MGGVISAVRDAITESDKKVADMAKENLQQCQASAEKIANNFKLQVLEVYKNPEEFNKWQVAGGRQDREDTFIGVSTKKTPSSDITAGVQSLVKGIFGVMEKKGSADTFQTAVSNMIGGAFDAFLGNASAGSTTKTKFLIIPHGYAFHRVDIFMYKYTFTSQGFTDSYDSQTVVYASRGILDIQDLKRGELLSYVSEITDGDKVKMTQWMNDFRDMYKLAGETMGDVAPDKRSLKVLQSSSAIPEVFSLPGPKALKHKAASSPRQASPPSSKRPRRQRD